MMSSRELTDTKISESDCGASTYSSAENMPSPARTQLSEESARSHLTFHSLNTDIDNNSSTSPKSPEKSCSPGQRDRENLCELQRELEVTKNRLYEIERQFSKFRAVSRREQEELKATMKVQRETDELNRRLEEELSYFQELYAVGGERFGTMMKDELRSLHRKREELKQTCTELNQQRDSIMREIKEYSEHHLNLLRSDGATIPYLETLQKSYEQLLSSLEQDVQSAKNALSRLGEARDEIINEMVMLNTKNAELTSMNNDISRRVSEREREAMAVMAGTSFLSSTGDAESATHTTRSSGSSSDAASEAKKFFGRRSGEHSVPPPPISESQKLFKFKRANVFGMLGRSKKTDGVSDAIVTVPYDSIAPETEQDHALSALGQHSLHQTKFTRPVRCDVCAEKMRRVSELKCQGCGVACHTKCAANISPTCTAYQSSEGPTTPKPVVIFGNDLRKQVQAENRTVPQVVECCIVAVEARGMDFEGIYRKSGGAGQMRLIQQAFEQGHPIDMCDEDECNDICAVTSVLKQYFRDLPNPLFTHELHSQFMAAIMMEDYHEKLREFQRLLHSLPVEHYNTAKYLLEHLDK
ncbi:hypothetical protein EC973_001387 [Apophysomyces ossiformis]|uniref:Uncharacterized protein n=1 Tax=Apophysomyces ossiformis TaxID=679940 RepID=A0A8H7BUT5_9FUNG|nr:hypothetical protein EC973_001387 [Apophysomyces ossiformis]